MFDARGWPRVFLVTIVGALFCIGVALYIDSFNFVNLSEAARERAKLPAPAFVTVPLSCSFDSAGECL